MAITNLFRWIHLLAGTAWLGEVLVVNVVLVPVLARLFLIMKEPAICDPGADNLCRSAGGWNAPSRRGIPATSGAD